MSLTRDQANIAGAVRDELLMMFEDARQLVTRALVMESTCASYKLPQLDGGLMPKLAAAVLACEAAHDAFAEFSATVKAQTGDPAAGGALPAAGEPLKAAA